MSNITSIFHNEVKLPTQFYPIFSNFLVKAKYSSLNFKLSMRG